MNKQLEAEIAEFSKQMSEKYNCHVVLVPETKVRSIEKVYEIVNELFVKINSDSPKEIVEEGIRTKQRGAEVVVFRQIFTHIAREMGYSFYKIGKLVGRHHATVIYSVRACDHLLKARDHQTIRIYNLIQNKLHYAAPN